MSRIFPFMKGLFRTTLILFAMMNANIVMAQEVRFALVVGNGAYDSLPTLRNPQNDAHAVSETLASLGFIVYLATDLPQAQLATAFDIFEVKSRNADVKLIYYAGHSASALGANLVFSTDFDPDAPLRQSPIITLEHIQNRFQSSKGTNIIIFDACSETIAISDGTERIKTQPISPNPPPIGTLISYASAMGKTAYDGVGRHSLFTGALLDNLKQPDTDIEVMLRAVRRDVIVNSQGEQVPQTHSALISDFKLFPTEQTVSTKATFRAALAQTGFSSKTVLTELSNGLTAPSDHSLNKDEKAILIQELCSALEFPRPAICDFP